MAHNCAFARNARCWVESGQAGFGCKIQKADIARMSSALPLAGRQLRFGSDRIDAVAGNFSDTADFDGGCNGCPKSLMSLVSAFAMHSGG